MQFRERITAFRVYLHSLLMRANKKVHHVEHYCAVAYAGCETLHMEALIYYVSLGLLVFGLLVIIAERIGE